MEKEIIHTLELIQRVVFKILNKMEDKNKKGWINVILGKTTQDYIAQVSSILRSYNLENFYFIRGSFKLPNNKYVFNKIILKIRYERIEDLENFLNERF